MSPKEELDQYLIGSNRYNPVLTFPPLSLFDMAEQDVRVDTDNNKFEIIIHNGPGGYRPIELFMEVVNFIDEVMINEKRVGEWISSFHGGTGEVDREKAKEFNRCLMLFLQNGAISKSLYEAFPDNGLRRYYLGRFILGAHLEIPIECYEDPLKEFKKRIIEEELFGSLTKLDPLVVMVMMRDFCSRVISEHQRMRQIKGEKPCVGGESKYLSIAITEKELTLLKYFAHKFESFIFLDSDGKGRLQGIRGKGVKKEDVDTGKVEPSRFLDSKHKGHSLKPRERARRVELDINKIDIALKANEETLSHEEGKILKLKFGLLDGVTRTFKEIGIEFGLSRQRVQQIEAEALKKLEIASGDNFKKN